MTRTQAIRKGERLADEFCQVMLVYRSFVAMQAKPMHQRYNCVVLLGTAHRAMAADIEEYCCVMPTKPKFKVPRKWKATSQ